MSTLAILKAEGKIEGVELTIRIKDLFEAGKTVKEISKELNTDFSEVKVIVERLGLK